LRSHAGRTVSFDQFADAVNPHGKKKHGRVVLVR
jgi:hypothetical protein